MSDELKMRIFVNNRVKMSRGKYAAMAVHSALEAVGAHPGTPVVVLGAGPEEIEKLSTHIHDEGRTEIEPGTLASGTDFQVEDAEEKLAIDMAKVMWNTDRSGSLEAMEFEDISDYLQEPYIDMAWAVIALQRKRISRDPE